MSLEEFNIHNISCNTSPNTNVTAIDELVVYSMSWELRALVPPPPAPGSSAPAPAADWGPPLLPPVPQLAQAAAIDYYAGDEHSLLLL